MRHNQPFLCRSCSYFYTSHPNRAVWMLKLFPASSLLPSYSHSCDVCEQLLCNDFSCLFTLRAVNGDSFVAPSPFSWIPQSPQELGFCVRDGKKAGRRFPVLQRIYWKYFLDWWNIINGFFFTLFVLCSTTCSSPPWFCMCFQRKH